MKRTKQILSVFLSVCMIISCMVGMSVTASADDLYESFTTNTGASTYTGEHFTISVNDVGDWDGLFLWSREGKTATISAKNGETITKLEATRGYYNVNDITCSDGTKSVSGDVATFTNVNKSSVTLGGSDAVQVKAVKVYYTEGSSTPATTTGGFVKVTAESQITEDNIGEATEAEARAWIKANLTTLKSEQGGEYDFFWKENGTLKLICLDYDELDEDNVNYADVLNPSIGNASRYFNNNENVYFWGGSSTPAPSETETLLTTITPTGKTTYSETTSGVVTVSHNNDTYYDEYGWIWKRTTDTLTVSGCEGYTITKVIFKQNEKSPVTDSSAPFELHFERSRCQENRDMDGVTSIEVYGYASTPSTPTPPTATVSPEGAGSVTVEEDPANSDNWLFTATPNEGYKFKWWALDHSNAPTGKYLTNTTSIVKTNFTESAGNNMITGITAVFEVSTYNISFDNGGTAKVDGTVVTSAAEGAIVTIVAPDAEPGTEFNGWTSTSEGVTFADAEASTTTFTMPANDVTISASFQNIAYNITMLNGGTAYVDGEPATTAEAGTVVTIKAKSSVSTPARFNGWTTTTEGVEFADADSPETTFVMPISDVTITASFEGVTPYIPSYVPSNTSTTTTTTANAPAETMTFEGEETISHTNLLSWSSVSGASSYLISVKTDGKFVPLATTTKTNIDVVHAYNGKYYVSEGGKYTAYTYKDGKFVKGGTITAAQADKLVKANNVTDTYMLQYTKNGKLSSEKSALTVSVKVYYKPAVKASSKNGKVILKWKKVVGAEKYRVYKYEGGKLVKIADTTANAVRISKVTAGKTYKYAVKAYVDGKWTKVTKSDIVSVKVK